MFSSYIVLGSIYGIILGMSGNYLLGRFNLKKILPKLALNIKYKIKLKNRRRVSKYYIYYNF